MNGHDELDRILKARFVPQMRSHLPERIIAASLKEPVRKVNAAVSWLSDFWDSFALPRPALAMAVALIIGVAIGMMPDSSTAVSDGDFFMQAKIQADLGDML